MKCGIVSLIRFPSDSTSVFRHDDVIQARPVVANPEPVNIRADRMTARFNPPVISVNGFDLLDEVPADIPLKVLVEKQFDIFTQFTLITLQAYQIISLFIINLLTNFALAPHRINGHDRAFDAQQFQQFRDGRDLIGFVIDLALSENEFLDTGPS